MRIEAPAMEHPKVARQTLAPEDTRGKLRTTGQSGNRKMATMSWYGRVLIINMLLVAAGWELFRLIVAIITLD